MEASKRQKLAVNNDCEGIMGISPSNTDYGCFGAFGGGNDLILSEILSRLPVKSLMKFKSVCKHWIALITQDRYFIDLYNARSEARQYNDDSINHTTATLFISPVRPCGAIDTECSATLKSPTEIGMLDAIVAEKEETKMILFSLDHQDGPSGAVAVHSSNSNIILPISHVKRPLELVSSRHTSTLEPIYGLVCFVNLDNYGSVLIYNPSTREKTSWIRTRTSILLEDIFLDQKLDRSLEKRTAYSCMFGFGFNTATKEHKVLCIYQINTLECTHVSCEGRSTYDEYRETYCEVMTVGENIWRKIDDHKVPQNLKVGEKSMHVNGSIYWMCYKFQALPCENRTEVIMAFDVASEEFREIKIPTFILHDLWHMDLFGRTGNWTNELADVDGHLAILDLKQIRDENRWMNLWILDEEARISSTCSTNNVKVAGDGAKWRKEGLEMPYRWEEIRYLAFKAITRTNLIVFRYFLKNSRPHEHEYLHYYDRKERRWYTKQVDMVSNHTRPYDITTFFETLTPVQTE